MVFDKVTQHARRLWLKRYNLLTVIEQINIR
jgi:hypothetical protein